MLRKVTVGLVVLVLSSSMVWAKTFYVYRTADAGKGTLRWAIQMANTRWGPDTVAFDASLTGVTLRPLSALPALTDGGTTVDGDTDGDGDSDIELRGSRAGAGADGLHITQPTKSGCVVQYLTITDWQGNGVHIDGSGHNEIVGCNFGVRLDGTTVAQNGPRDIYIVDGLHNVIGGPDQLDRNVIAGGAAADREGIKVSSARSTRVYGCYFGVRRDGSDVLRPPRPTNRAIYLTEDTYDGYVYYNTFGGCGRAVMLGGPGTRRNSVRGNTAGLLPDGDTPTATVQQFVVIENGAHNNTIGGTAAGDRNVVSVKEYGVRITGPGCEDNLIQGNYFGLNAAGDADRKLGCGVLVDGGAGPQIIGGSASGAGNYICPGGVSGITYGVKIDIGSGSGTTIEGNSIGLRPDGGFGPRYSYGCHVTGAEAYAGANAVARADIGLYVTGSGSRVQAHGNTFARSNYACYLELDGRAQLGNLGNAGTDDDGGNYFKPSCQEAIHNDTPYKVKAEGNRWGTTSAAEIEASIHDRKDDPSLGRVDFDPLKGGVAPSGGTVGVAGLVAVPTAIGAEVMFTLTAAADVEARVLNLAGRPVKTLCRSMNAEAGTNALVWNASCDSGLRAPNGTYLVEITATADDGQSTKALTRVMLKR